MAKHPQLKHIIGAILGFTAGYLLSIMIEGTFGWHAYIAGAIGNLIVNLSVHYLFT